MAIGGIMLIPLTEPFSLYHTLTCGQAFRWQKKGEWFLGVVGKNVVMVRENGGGIEVNTNEDMNRVRDYFRCTDDFGAILCELRKDKILNEAANLFLGLRLLRQDPWECLVSYVCSIASNIAKICYTIENMAACFGERMNFEGEVFFAFPTCESLAQAKMRELRKCGLGFRAKYVSSLAQVVEKESVDLLGLRKGSCEEARKELIALPGVGEKVADCVCLFSLDKLEAFPVDRWIRKVMVWKYIGRRVSDAKIRAFAQKRFGLYAGYAQEYLFAYARTLRFK